MAREVEALVVHRGRAAPGAVRRSYRSAMQAATGIDPLTVDAAGARSARERCGAPAALAARLDLDEALDDYCFDTCSNRMCSVAGWECTSVGNPPDDLFICLGFCESNPSLCTQVGWSCRSIQGMWICMP